jgi:hypothetical protein
VGPTNHANSKISVSGTSTIATLDSFSIAPVHVKWLTDGVSMAHLVAQDLQSLPLFSNPQLVPQTVPGASASPPNYGKSV